MMAKKRRYKKRKKQTSQLDITIVGLIIFSILLAVLIYTKSGIIGSKLNEILGGMLGIMQYVLPIGIFIIAIKIACENEEMGSKLTQYVIAIVSLSIMFSVFQLASGELLQTKNMGEIVQIGRGVV